MHTVLLIMDVLVAISLVGLILIQQGKGADVGAAFGSGASQTVFGSQGSASFLTRATAVLAVLFFSISLALAYLSGQHIEKKSVTDIIAPITAPATLLPKAPMNGTTPAPAVPAQAPPAPADVPQ
ncbi:MAG: preprotein translocase subunit SecG [Gammaproteobacteria bacterium]|nr:preprotein translocase subunit SecG [Gammaproteobacteria bacterium]